LRRPVEAGERRFALARRFEQLRADAGAREDGVHGGDREVEVLVVVQLVDAFEYVHMYNKYASYI